MLVGARLIITCVCQDQDAGNSSCVGLETLAQQRLAVVGHHQRLRGCVLRLCEGLHRREQQQRQNQAGVKWVPLPCSLGIGRQLGSAMHLDSSIATSRHLSTASGRKHELGRHIYRTQQRRQGLPNNMRAAA